VRRRRIHSNLIQLEIVRRWMISASIFTLLAVRGNLKLFRRPFGSAFSGHPSVSPSSKIFVQLVIFSCSSNHRSPRPSLCTKGGSPTHSFLSCSRLYLSSSYAIVWPSYHRVVPSSCLHPHITTCTPFAPKHYYAH
jgi:hypothetical protein